MALNRIRYCNLYPRIILRISRQWYSNIDEKIASIEEFDAIDDFTSQLLQKKIGKWEVQKSSAKFYINNTKNINCRKDILKENKLELKDVDNEVISRKFQEAIENDNNDEVINLMRQCVKLRKCPSLNVLFNAISICAQSGDLELVNDIKELCGELQPHSLEVNSNFQHFVAEAVWVKGDVSKAIELFEQVYRENAFLRRRIRLMLKYLIVDLVANRSEAALLNIIRFSERLVKEFKDYFPLTCIWQSCILSDWFSDQQHAYQLMEKNYGFCKTLTNQIPYVVFVSLRSHKTDVVYNLLEVFLKHKMNFTIANILVSLLDYYFYWGNKRGCFEIIHWAIRNNIDLPENLHVNLIKLLVRKHPDALADVIVKENRKIQKPKFNLKF